MGFNKKKGISAVCALIVLAVFNAVAFLLPVDHTVTFWLGYSFVTLATALMLVCILFLFNTEDSSRTFLRLSVAKIGWMYFIIQFADGIWQITNFNVPYLAALISNCVLTGFFIITVLCSKAAGESIEKQEAHVAQKVFFLKNIQSVLASIKAEDAETQNKIERLQEDFRFSDPMSHSMLSELEKQIESKVVMLKSDISDKEKADNEIECISDLLKERNQKCKMLKNVKEEKTETDNSGIKYVTVTISILAVLATVALVVGFVVVPSNKYKTAMALYEEEKYEDAIVVFESLGDFSDSTKMVEVANEAINEREYQAALALFEDGKFDEAIEAFTKLASYKDSIEMIETVKDAVKEKKYLEAQKLFEDKKYEEAIVVFEELDTYKNSKEMIESVKLAVTDNKYALAEKQFNDQNYLEAIKLYRELGEYKDSKQKIEQINNRLSEDESVYFGSYKGEPIAWQVIESDENKMLLIAKNVVCELPYNNEIKNVSWNESSLCKWLNGEFIESFSENQYAQVLETNTDGENFRVFLLSKEETEKLEEQSLLSCDKDWWLRSKAENNAVYVSENGTVSDDGDSVVHAKGVRPCIWINLK